MYQKISDIWKALGFWVQQGLPIFQWSSALSTGAISGDSRPGGSIGMLNALVESGLTLAFYGAGVFNSTIRLNGRQILRS
ncbi:MAG: hypothetical protein RBT34_06100 [Anaerolineaceae bacterium]|nr:hypothetical protein [Anaerolineaceae bacterium]